MRKILLREIAAEAGVSVRTVLRVLNGEEHVTSSMRRHVSSVLSRNGYLLRQGRRRETLAVYGRKDNRMIDLFLKGISPEGYEVRRLCYSDSVRLRRETFAEADLAVLFSNPSERDMAQIREWNPDIFRIVCSYGYVHDAELLITPNNQGIGSFAAEYLCGKMQYRTVYAVLPDRGIDFAERIKAFAGEVLIGYPSAELRIFPVELSGIRFDTFFSTCPLSGAGVFLPGCVLAREFMLAAERLGVPCTPLDDLIAMRQKKGYEGFLTLRYPFIVNSMTSQAAVAALRPGDEIRAVDELRNAEFPEYQKYIASKAGDSVHLEVLRGDNTLQIALPVSDEGVIGVISSNQIYTPRTQKYTFWESIPAGIHRTGEMLSSYWEQLKLIVQPKTKMYEELGGFIAIGSIFPSEWNWQDFWIKTAFLSIILAVMNIIPIPGLDGGHAIFTFWEMITRRKVSEKVLEMAQYVGMFILLMLLLYANGNDIYRFFIK